MRQKTKEEYVEAIHVLERQEGRARTSRLAETMGNKPPSITKMLKNLQDEGLVTYEVYAGAHLTPAGIRLAKRLMKKHRLLADFFEMIGVERELAEVDACEIEHHISPPTMEQLESFVRFMQSTPRLPTWMERFRKSCESGPRV